MKLIEKVKTFFDRLKITWSMSKSMVEPELGLFRDAYYAQGVEDYSNGRKSTEAYLYLKAYKLGYDNFRKYDLEVNGKLTNVDRVAKRLVNNEYKKFIHEYKTGASCAYVYGRLKADPKRGHLDNMLPTEPTKHMMVGFIHAMDAFEDINKNLNKDEMVLRIKEIHEKASGRYGNPDLNLAESLEA